MAGLKWRAEGLAHARGEDIWCGWRPFGRGGRMFVGREELVPFCPGLRSEADVGGADDVICDDDGVPAPRVLLPSMAGVRAGYKLA